MLVLFRSRRSVRSGYAFAHQEGFGRLITSGKIMRPNPLHVQPQAMARHKPAQTQAPPQSHQVMTAHMTRTPNAAATAAAGLVSSSISQVANGGSTGLSRKRNTNDLPGNGGVQHIPLSNMGSSANQPSVVDV